MRGVTKYQVKCNNCTRSDEVGILDDRDLIWDGNKYIISGRKRLDGEWGWQCTCGNYSLVTKQERQEIKNLQSPDPKDIGRVIDNLIVERDGKFTMSS